MKYDLNLRSRATIDDDPQAKVDRLELAMRKVEGAWRLADSFEVKRVDFGTYTSWVRTFSRGLPKGVSGYLLLHYRAWYLKDHGSSDDFLAITFNPAKVAFREFVTSVLPSWIVAFDGYRCELGIESFPYTLESSTVRASTSYRNAFLGVKPTTFFDSLLCERAFGITLEEAAKRLLPMVESVQHLGNGLYVIGSSLPLEMDASRELSEKMLGALHSG